MAEYLEYLLIYLFVNEQIPGEKKILFSTEQLGLSISKTKLLMPNRKRYNEKSLRLTFALGL